MSERIIYSIVVIFISIVVIYWGYFNLKKYGDGITMTNKTLIYYGIIGLILGLLGLLGVGTWSK